MNHRLTITPGIPPGHRHGIEDVLKTLGYFIVGGGQMINGAESDISFDDPKTKSLWLQELIKQNILIHSGGLINLCYSHSFADIDKAITAFDIVLKLIKENKVELEGEIVQPAFRRL